ncbi:MAG TPA: glycosyltransferase [Bryobacteraceae bacterium]|nr:glycosyltransferase [Bryobacteraceae bacterium]
MPRAAKVLLQVPLLLLSPLLIAVSFMALGLTDALWKLAGRRRLPAETLPDRTSASVVIPNWNGRDLLEKYLPSVVTAMGSNPANEVIVVDNASSDGSAAYVREHFPKVRVIELPRNLGFGGGSNTGIAAAKNDIVVLLNSDMRVEADFLQPLLDGFTDERVFAVSCQIFFSDPNKKREETGLTQAWWDSGRLRVRHRADDAVTDAFPCFYAGGGSSAYDRRKFLELGGFDSLLHPFYLEDTDLGYMAWKRGWKVLYQPRSVVFHEHRGTIGKKFSQQYIDGILKKNFVLFCWKNIHEMRKLAMQFIASWADAIVSMAMGESPERANFAGLYRAAGQLPQAVAARWRARSLAAVNDTEAFRRPLGGYFRDRFEQLPPRPDKLSVMFVSPYPICPPTHGGGVFMYQTATELAQLVRLHLIVLLDTDGQRAPHDDLVAQCASAEFVVRMTGRAHSFGSPYPHAVAEFSNGDLEWLIHRQILLQKIDVLQLEYMPLGQYACDFRQIPSILFEHDIYFQSIARQLPGMKSMMRRVTATFEYLRALRYELTLLPKVDRIQVCSVENHHHLLTFLPSLRGTIDDDLRAGIDTSRYALTLDGRQPDTMLFLGSFRHLPNQEGLEWFTRFVLPRIVEQRPNAKLVVIGSDPPARHALPGNSDAIQIVGFVEDIQAPLHKYSVFVCPILSGSGVRVKLLEAFASGIPVVSTPIGAEGLANKDGEICALADDPEAFADKVVALLSDPSSARELAARARRSVVEQRDMRTLTQKLEQNYRNEVRRKREITSSP